MTPLLFIGVAIGGSIGAVVRYLITLALAGRRWSPLPVVLVNILGSLISGVAIGAVDDPAVLLLLVTGFCGGLTTFSTLSVESIQLILDGHRRRAAASLGITVIVGVAAVVVGVLMGTAITS